MTKADKRARKKEFRDAARAEREAALRRRRNFRAAGAVGVLLLLVGMAMFGSRFSGDEGRGGNGAGGNQDPPAAACGAEAPPPADPKVDYSEPEQVLEEGVDYAAVVTTSCGTIEMDLLEETAPESVNNFVFLSREGYYDGLTWHRVEADSVLQTGDPNGQNGVEPDGPGYTIKDELPESMKDYVYGVVGMANAGPNTGGSQWFIVIHKEGPAGYQPFYSIFGEVTGGEVTASEEDYGCEPATGGDTIPILELLGCQPTQGGADPSTAVQPQAPIYIEQIEVTEA